MKYLILLLTLCACSKKDLSKKYVYYHDNTVCHKGGQTSCGMRLRDCENNWTYDCVQNVRSEYK